MCIDSALAVGFLVSGAALALLCSGAVALAQAAPFRPFLGRWKRLGKWERRALVLILTGAAAFAGTKPDLGGGGADSAAATAAANAVGSAEGGMANCALGTDGEANADSAVGPLSSDMSGGAPDADGGSGCGDAVEMPEATPGDRTAGFAPCAAGHGETFDFTPPAGAVVATNWLRHGASTQPIRLAFGDWIFPLGEKGHSHFTVFASGEVMPGEVNADEFLRPFAAPLGILPQAKWGLLPSNETSLFWRDFTPSNTLLLTWRNVLFGRSAANLVSFQAELKPSGGFAFRYDLSRLAADVPLTNAAIEVQADGTAFAATPAANLTSLAFRSHDERRCDEGREEFDRKLGDCDPHACPEGSTNSVLEHVFYSGTTNGAFSYPQSTGNSAVLTVSVSGSGSGELMVGSAFVPLEGRSRSLSRLSAAPPTSLAVSVPRGLTQKVYMRGDSTLSVSFASADFAFGELPDLSGRRCVGNINFPFVNATVPCIHDYNARRKLVSLPLGSGADDLRCEWTGTDKVEVENVAPVSALLTGRFSGRTTTSVTYALAHPRYLFGRKTYSQTARYCPSPPEADGDADQGWGGGGYYDGECEDDSCGGGDEDDDWWDVSAGDDSPADPDPDADDEAEARDNCPHLTGVLRIREPLEYADPIRLTVPDERRDCCPCPEHASNWVAVVYRSPRLKIVEADGEREFAWSGRSLDVRIAGVAPSSGVGDAEICIAANGEVCFEGRYTVLGVGIGKHDADLGLLNWMNPGFGLPIPVSADASAMTDLFLKTEVRLPGGNIHVGLEDATGQFTVWHYDPGSGEYLVLVDSETGSRDFSYGNWRRMVGGSTDAWTSETPVFVTSSAAGSATLVYRYWGVVDGRYVFDEARQAISSVDAPLLADVSRDGSIDADDAALQGLDRPFRFWSNEDRLQGDCVGADPGDAPNADDAVVNGKSDLVNLFPVRVDLSGFRAAWGGLAELRLRCRTRNLRYCVLGDLAAENVAAMVSAPVHVAGGGLLESAALSGLDGEGVDLDGLLPDGESACLLAFEAKDAVSRWEGPEIVASLDGTEVFAYLLPVEIRPVDEMYRYLNLRGAEADPHFVAALPGEPANLPDAETDSRHFVFVHGYNVGEARSRDWARAMFKRLWWAGSRSKFTAVDWRGDDSQLPVPTQGVVSPNYYANVEHAFGTAAALKNACAQLPGTKVMLAHSLGNVLVSASARDFGLQYAKYYMLNAAVPMEAYRQSDHNDLMVDGAWKNVDAKFRAARFSDQFDNESGRDDFRRSLSWKGRFAGIANAVNCYSPTEDVLANPSTLKVFGVTVGETAGGAWAKQELFKGCSLWYGVNAVTFAGTRIEGGWGINAGYVANPLAYIPLVGFNASYFADCTREDLIASPLFTSFNDDRMSSTNLLDFADYGLRAKMLGDAIPAESFAAGANATGGLAGNYNFQDQHVDGWPRNDKLGKPLWYHSDVKDIPFYFTYPFFIKVVEEDNL